MIQKIEKLSLIKEFRTKVEEQDTQELKTKREDWLQWLLVHNWNPLPEFLEMYKTKEGEVLKGKIGDSQYPSKWINTRTKILSETRAEIDKLEFDKALNICLEIIKILMAKGYHFAVFYAEGQRSPHIIIYDFEELAELTIAQRYKAQMEFWRSLIPFFFHYLDFSIFHDDHYLPLEFAIHYRTGTPFNLLFEWLPESEEKCNI